MALLGSEVVRLGISGFSQIPYGSFAGKAAAPPVFSGTIADISLTESDSTTDYDLSTYFTGADSYSIAPSVETGWTFNTSTGVLTILPDTVGTFGTYVVTATNTGGTADSNAFGVTVSEVVSEATGGWWYTYDHELAERKRKKKEIEALEAKAEQIKSTLDRELAKELRKQEKEQARISELRRLTKLAQEHKEELKQSVSQKAILAADNAMIKGTYSAMEML